MTSVALQLQAGGKSSGIWEGRKPGQPEVNKLPSCLLLRGLCEVSSILEGGGPLRIRGEARTKDLGLRIAQEQ